MKSDYQPIRLCFIRTGTALILSIMRAYQNKQAKLKAFLSMSARGRGFLMSGLLTRRGISRNRLTMQCG